MATALATSAMVEVQQDTLSEVSSRGDSREDLRELAAALGIPSISEIAEDRFRIDRRKLEAMLVGEDGPQAAESFFQRVMEETGTHISWPSRLKIGAKSKKDPHIRVAGRRADVKAAKDMVMGVFDTRSNRVTMKLDVSYTDHSHIIGKGGLTIKKVMEETGCHIHFPDSNRSNPNEKNNQVSISGEMKDVEKARARVRMLTPLIFSFELPVVGLLQSDPASAYLQQLQEQYNVQVSFRTRAKLNATLVIVKGCEWEVVRVKEATLLLISHLYPGVLDQVLVQMTIEISPQHHPIVLGKNRENLKVIMQRTGTKILFPDAGDPAIATLKKSNVNITGMINNVYLARQQLLGSLPLLLMFDLPEDMVLDLETVNSLAQNMDVLINVRHKPKQNTYSVSIKGIERHASKIYEARKLLLNLNEPSVLADIPDTYLVPNDFPVFAGAMNNLGKFSVPLFMNTNYRCSSGCSSGYTSQSPPLLSPVLPAQTAPWALSALMPPLHHPYLSQQLLVQHHASMMSSMSGSSGYGSRASSSLSVGSDSNNSKVQPSISSTTSPITSPSEIQTEKSPPNQHNSTDTEDLGNMILNIMDCTDNKPLGSEKLKELVSQQPTSTCNYDQKRNKAIEAICRSISTDLRIPTSAWSGYGFSQSSPTPEMKVKQSGFFQDTVELDPWKSPNRVMSPVTLTSSTSDFNRTLTPTENENVNLSSSNYLDSTPKSTVNQIMGLKTNDISSLLTSLGLEKYIRVFTHQEIDINIFRSLTENDLKEIGVTALGARRKLLLAISEMNRRQNLFSGSAAPGAERKYTTAVTGNKLLDNW